MALLRKIEQILEHLPISASSSDPDIPTMQAVAVSKYILPVIGPQLLQQLETEANTLFPDPLPEDAEIPEATPLFKLVIAALVPLSYLEEMPFLHTRITTTGLKNITTDTMQGAYRYQYENLLQVCETNGLLALENVYNYLMENKDSYTEWVSSDAYKKLNKNLIKTGTHFAEYFKIYQPYRTFNAIQPFMTEVEDLYIIPVIGADFFNELKGKGDTATAEEKTVINMLCKAIANLTMYKAATKLSVKISADGVTISLSPGTDRQNNGENSASNTQVSGLRSDAERDGNNYLNMAVTYLNITASAGVFTTYFNSQYYSNPNEPKEDKNAAMNGIFAL